MYSGWSKKIDLEEKGLRNSKIFFDGVFLSMFSHLVKLEFSKLHRKKLWGSKNPVDGLFKKSQLSKKRHISCPFFVFI